MGVEIRQHAKAHARMTLAWLAETQSSLTDHLVTEVEESELRKKLNYVRECFQFMPVNVTTSDVQTCLPCTSKSVTLRL